MREYTSGRLKQDHHCPFLTLGHRPLPLHFACICSVRLVNDRCRLGIGVRDVRDGGSLKEQLPKRVSWSPDLPRSPAKAGM